MQKFVYSFGSDHNEGDVSQKNLLGGKGANLADMASIGLPVPAGFTITTDVCTHYYNNNKKLPPNVMAQVKDALSHVEKNQNKKFGCSKNPLLVSVRSGARVSMPGMMDTVLNLGLNDQTIEGLVQSSGDARFAWDSYRRFIQMYGDVVLGVSHDGFEYILDGYKNDNKLSEDTEISAYGWREIVEEYKELVKREWGHDFPQDPMVQLENAIIAVFDSWQTTRAVTYRRIHSIPEEWGTAVSVQAMVFGNMGDDCATGVAFTRDPSTGENYFYGEYLINAQGEDVVAGIRTPQPIAGMDKTMPNVFRQLNEVRLKLESHYRDMQDIEFTVERGKLYMLQTRSGKRTAAAALKIAVDMVNEKLITRDEALLRLDASSLDQLLHPTLDPKAKKNIVARGLPASPGAASGIILFSADEVEQRAKDGVDTILVRIETSPEDIHGMHAARGILTSRGGMTSHAAVVARGMGRPCVAGCGAIQIDYKSRTMRVGDLIVNEGDEITIDGAKGEVMIGKVSTLSPQLSGDFVTIMAWADDVRRMNVRANAETPDDARAARNFGAQGIGLCRTEHMFFDPQRIQHVREMILAHTDDARQISLDRLCPEQQNDFEELFTIMKGLPVTIRLLDPPLHEFLPHSDKDIDSFAKASGLMPDQVRRRISELTESNPMLGHRGCRLGLTYPAIYAMQARAIFEAAVNVSKKTGDPVIPEIMIPLIATRAELTRMKKIVDDEAHHVFEKHNVTLSYQVGTMIELPRAALMADDIAHDAEFFSFGTNDLTQTTLGMSRDDAGTFLPFYVEKSILPKDPFVTIDVDGVGQLVRMACERGKETRPNLKLGICGEHGGDPDRLRFSSVWV